MIDFNHRSPGERLNALIDDAIIRGKKNSAPRDYLGASLIGKSCSRAIQYDFFHTEPDPGKELSAQTLRIFEVGHALEELAIRWIRKAGFDLRVMDGDGNQFGFESANGLIQGHIDGVLCSGPPMTIAFPALWECKTMNSKKWKSCAEKGVEKSHPQYAQQIALYQAYMNLDENPAILTCINKDTQELHHQSIPFNPKLAQSTSDKAVTILKACKAGELLPRIASSPDHFECKWCAYGARCWGVP